MDPARIAVVASDPDERERVARALEGAGHEVHAAECPEGAPLSGRDSVHVLVIAEDCLPGGADGAWLVDLVVRNPALPCLVTVGGATVAHTVELMRRGAFCVLPEPVSRRELLPQVEQALRHHRLCARNAELQRNLETHERLAMIGKLAAGVAHELNNPLDGVLRYVNLAAGSLPADCQQIPYLVEARRGLRRMADIVRDLLQFSRNATVESADEDARRMAQDAVGQVVALAPHKRVQTAFDFPADGVPLPRAMFQVLGNLAKNAVDAMPSGGTLRVSAHLDGERVVLLVEDSGAGIPPEICERIFEPFFTTKEVGSGTGLGLPICQRIVERLGGTLTLHSEVGVGTTVEVDLPLRGPAGRSDSSGSRVLGEALATLANPGGNE